MGCLCAFQFLSLITCTRSEVLKAFDRNRPSNLLSFLCSTLTPRNRVHIHQVTYKGQIVVHRKFDFLIYAGHQQPSTATSRKCMPYSRHRCTLSFRKARVPRITLDTYLEPNLRENSPPSKQPFLTTHYVALLLFQPL